MPQNTVNAMLQDRSGYLWVGTFAGAARFNGDVFATIIAAQTLCLHESRSGDVWVGRVSNLTRWRNGRSTDYTTADGLPSPYISSIREDAQGTLWINTAGGVARYNGVKFEVYPSHRGVPVREFFLQERDGSMWFRSGGNVVRFGADGSVSTMKPEKPSVFLLEEARDGSVWIALRDQYRLMRYRERAFSDVPLPRVPKAGQPSAFRLFSMAMTTDAKGDVLVHTPVGLVRIVDGRLSAPEPLPLPGNRSEPPKVRSLLVDREGDLWVGTIGAGLVRCRPAPLTAYGKDEGLSDQNFYSVFQDREGRIWLGGDSLYWMDEHGFHLFPGVISIHSITQTRNGDLWFGGYDGLYRWAAGKLSHFKFEAPSVSAIHEDRQGVLWIGGIRAEREGGIYRFHDGQFDRVPGLSGVSQIIEDPGGGLWVGGNEGVLSIRGGESRFYDHAHGVPGPVNPMYADSTGTLWLGIVGGTIVRMRDGKLKAITPESGLARVSPMALLEDGQGDLWLGSNQGIFRYSLKDLNDVADGRRGSISAVSYGAAEGMRSSECNGEAAAWKARDGRLWFGTLRGAVAIDPNAGDRVPPPVVLEAASANQFIIGLDGRTSAPPGKNTLDFQFAGLSLSAPGKQRFKYRLEPYDADWIDAGTQHTAHYTNMPPGDYSFRVIAANSFGVWNDQGATVHFTLQPHFYQTLWFSFFVFGGLVLCATGAYRLRMRQLHAKAVHLEIVVDRRTAELRSEIKAREKVEAELRQARDNLEDRVRERTAALRESETRFRAFVDHATDAFFVIGADQRVIDVNRQACESLGYTRKELIGQRVFLFDADLNDEWLERNLRPRIATGESVTFETHHRRKDGTVFPVEVRARTLQRGQDSISLCLALNITERRQVEAERERLRELEAELAHINRVSMMGELTASIAHEVNQPLSGIVSNAGACLRWLGRAEPDLEEAREAARRIVRDGKRAGEVIARIRALTKRAATPREKLDLNDIVREVLALVGHEAKKTGVVIRMELAGDLWPVSGDRVQLQQVILNLVMNAIEAMSGVEGRARELAIQTRNAGAEMIEAAVQDTGVGLDPSTVAKIFEAFYTTKATGMGMGLSICRSIVKSHGGRLWAEANSGPGTTFYLTLAKYQDEGADAAAAGIAGDRGDR